jgi:hypothetical protein
MKMPASQFIGVVSGVDQRPPVLIRTLQSVAFRRVELDGHGKRCATQSRLLSTAGRVPG